MKQKFSAIIVLWLTAVLLLTAVSCSAGEQSSGSQVASVSSDVSAQSDEADSQTETKSFVFTVKFADGTEKSFDIETAEKTVGDALRGEGLIDGEMGAFGMYVKTVCGETHDYDTDGTYWAFYVGGEMSAVGVDEVEVENGAAYTFAAAK